MIDEHSFKAIYSYCESVSDSPSDILHELYRETHLKTLAPRMASGPVQGRFLSLFSKLVSPTQVLEIGTFTGYATLCIAEGLAENGHIHTIEVNPELNHISDKYFRELGVRDQITSHIGDAKTVIGGLYRLFDIVFIDAKKKDYSLYYDLVIDKVRQGGYILADNVLWDGKVYSGGKDATTKSLMMFNQRMKDDPRVETLLLPLRDGLSIMRKK
ncbi:MAG: caffeoyl-CoA O-methyltransferase [Saprospiraceae bacterium]|jgi:caffeoyl-CoA O-methyltransferase